jgi:hypothetical protein
MNTIGGAEMIHAAKKPGRFRPLTHGAVLGAVLFSWGTMDLDDDGKLGLVRAVDPTNTGARPLGPRGRCSSRSERRVRPSS